MSRRVLTVGSVLAALALSVGVGQAAEMPATAVQEIDPEQGIVITFVTPGGPAAEAGVVRGDILQEIDGETVHDVGDLLSALAEREPGDELDLTILHGDDLRSLTVTLGDRDGVALLGLTPACVSHEEMWVEAMAPPGVLITAVLAGSPAEEAGLLEGDVIVAIEGNEVSPRGDLSDALAGYEAGDAIVLQIERQGEDRAEIEVQLGEHPDDEDAPYLGVRYRSSIPWRAMEGTPLPFGGMHGFERFHLDEMPFRHMEEHEYEGMPFHHFEDFDFKGMPFPHLEEFDADELSEGETRQGSILRQVVEDSPAAAAGLQKGDVITALDGQPLDGPWALADAVAEREPGDEITLTVHRDDAEQPLDVEVTLGEHPEDEGAPYLGVTLGAFFMQRYQGDSEPEHLGPFWHRFDSDDESTGDGGQRRFGFDFHFDLPFELEDLPFDLDVLPERWRPFRWAPSEERGGGSIGESA